MIARQSGPARSSRYRSTASRARIATDRRHRGGRISSASTDQRCRGEGSRKREGDGDGLKAGGGAALRKTGSATRNGSSFGQWPGKSLPRCGRGYDAFTTGVGNVIGTNRDLVALSLAVRASASTWSMKISASMAVRPKFWTSR